MSLVLNWASKLRDMGLLGERVIDRTWGEGKINLDEFDLEGFTPEEVMAYNSMAEPGQRLQDTLTPKRIPSSMQKSSSKPFLPFGDMAKS